MEHHEYEAFIEEVKAKTDIVELIQATGAEYSLKRRGKYYVCTSKGFGSLNVDPAKQVFTWFAKPPRPGRGGAQETGDCIDWEHWYGGSNSAWEAILALARGANVPIPKGTSEDAGASPAAMAYRAKQDMMAVAAELFVKQMAASPAAMAYAQGRGWADETIEDAKLGFTGVPPTDDPWSPGHQAEVRLLKEDLRGDFEMHEHDPEGPLGVALLGFQGDVLKWAKEHDISEEEIPENWVERGRIFGMLDFPRLVFPHIERGRVTYFSARNLRWDGEDLVNENSEGAPKNHNLPAVLAGDRRVYWNHIYYPAEKKAMLVEGPPDGVTAAQLGMAAVARCGTGLDDSVVGMLKKHETFYVGIERDWSGWNAAVQAGHEIGPGTWLVEWPGEQWWHETTEAGFELGSQGMLIRPPEAVENPGSKEDLNDYLQNMIEKGIDREDVRAQRIKFREFLERSASVLIVLWAQTAGRYMKGATQDAAVKLIFETVKGMNPILSARYRETIVEALGIKVGEYNHMLKSAKGDEQEDERELDIEPIYTPGGWIEEHLVELLYDPERMRTRFAIRYPDGRVDEAEKLVIGHKLYRPFPANSLIMKGVVRLPSEMGERLCEKELLAVINAHLNKYFDYGSEAFFEETHTNYVLFSWVYDGFRTVPYLRGLGDFGTGKSRMLRAVGLICYRPIYTTAGSSAASLFRMLDIFRGTLVLDEGDFGNSDEASIIAKILNGGNEKGSPITRARKTASGGFDIEAFDVFGPKVIGMRKDFDDRAIASRCLTMEMVPMVPHPRIPLDLPPEFEEECREIRNLLLTFRMHTAVQDRQLDYNQTDRALEPRLNQITLSLLEVVQDQEIRDRIQAFMRDYNEQMRSERYQTKTARVLEGLMRAWAWGPVSSHESDAERVYLKDVAKAANDIMDEQKAAMGEEDDDDDRGGSGQGGKKYGKKMTSRGVTHILKKYLQLRTLRATDGDNANYKGTYFVDWDEERIRGLCERWGVEILKRDSLKHPTVVLKTKEMFEEEREAWQSAGEDSDTDERG